MTFGFLSVILVVMDLYQKISILGPSAQYDTCGPKDFGKTTDIPGVYHAKVGGSHICRLFKVLQSNACTNNCNYCAFRRDRDCNRVIATPDEMARAFDSAYSRRLVDGLFLSSGVINNASTTMTKMLDTAHILRAKYKYTGYLHLKLMPGSPENTVEEAMKVANRISVNIEAPTASSLAQLSPEKNLKEDLLKTLALVLKYRRKAKAIGSRRVPSLTTQFVIGAGNETDGELVEATNVLYEKFGLTRVFYSAFRPVPKTPLAEKPAESLVREHRLYQVDFLMRFYKFSPREIPLDKRGFLSETEDPKMLWAKNNPEFFPINMNTAGYYQLLRVPGIGPTSARKILDLRKESRINSFDRFAGLRVQVKKMSEFVTV